MALTMKQEQGVTEVAELLYDFLPASGAPITFGTAAHVVGVGDLWPGVKGTGLSKLPALTILLRETLDRRSASFCSLILEIVKNGLSYRRRKNSPVTRQDIEKLNAAVVVVGFKVPELWDRAFLEALPPGERPSPVQAPQAPRRPTSAPDLRPHLEELKAKFLQLRTYSDRQKAGLDLEALLNRLFVLFNLKPEEPFRVTGEQIDGSFDLDREIYLLEAKWTREAVGQDELLILRGKVEGKSQFTRGLFLSINGFTQQGADAFTRGKSPNCVMMDGAHLYRVFEAEIRLDDLLRRLVRHLATKGKPYLPASEW